VNGTLVARPRGGTWQRRNGVGSTLTVGGGPSSVSFIRPATPSGRMILELRRMAVDRTLLRVALRRRRTSLVSKTLLASSSSRRGAFSAAMQQFEELMSASAAVGPSSRPITLYYAIVQAGLAVAAAHKTGPWSFSQHGLKLQNPRAPIAEILVGPEGTGAFQIVAQATNSPSLQMPVTVGALWSSLPDFEFAKLPSSSAPIALGIHANYEPSVATVMVQDECPGPEKFKQHLSNRLSAYPSIDGFTVVEDSYEETQEQRWTAQLRWDHKIDLDDIAPAYQYDGNHFLRPSLDSQGSLPPSPFMTWWAMLFTFSVLSRYYPREWGAAINIDRSEAAALLEHCLDLALDAVPQFVLDALDRKLTLLDRPIEI
jgi:hypothetical protein